MARNFYDGFPQEMVDRITDEAIRRKQLDLQQSYAMKQAGNLSGLLGSAGLLGGIGCSQSPSASSSVYTLTSDQFFCSTAHSGGPYTDYMPDPSETKKAENKAVLLLQNIIGVDQCDVYRKTHRVILKPENRFWVIGDVREMINEINMFTVKPDVIRVDNAEKLHVTFFCVHDASDVRIPYTDKVVTLASHLLADEKAFYKTCNRIKEETLEKMPECAMWGV